MTSLFMAFVFFFSILFFFLHVHYVCFFIFSYGRLHLNLMYRRILLTSHRSDERNVTEGQKAKKNNNREIHFLESNSKRQKRVLYSICFDVFSVIQSITAVI